MDPTTIAALITGGSSILSSLLSKKPQIDSKQFSQYSPQQDAMFRQIMSQMSPELIKELYGPINEGQLRERFEKTTGDPARQQFSEQIIPELQELFSGLGSKGGDAEQYQLATAGRKLQEDLARQFEDTYSKELGERRGIATTMLGAQPMVTQPYITPGNTPGSDFFGGLGSTFGDVFSKWMDSRMNQTPGATPGSTPGATPGADATSGTNVGSAIWKNINRYI